MIEETMLLTHRTLILDQAAKRRLPTATTNQEFVRAGGLVSCGAKSCNVIGNWRALGAFCDRSSPSSKESSR